MHQDPIGLFGGVNLFYFAPNPFSWTDPLGLAGKGATGVIRGQKYQVASNLAEVRQLEVKVLPIQPYNRFTMKCRLRSAACIMANAWKARLLVKQPIKQMFKPKKI